MILPYQDFLRSKRLQVHRAGFEPSVPLNPALKPFQADIVRWALRLGRAAIFADCGLGKTLMQLEWGRQVFAYRYPAVLLLCPLSVAAQTKREAEKFGIDCPVTICRTQADVRNGINITNYEMLKHFDPGYFGGVILDESSILKSFMGTTKRRLIEMFARTPFRTAWTATPAPNDVMELGNHAEFLDVPGHNEMLARWFINDTMEAGAYRLKGHAEADFWRWVASWAVSLSKPSDLGYSDEGYELPPLRVHHEVVDVDVVEGRESGYLFRMPSLSAVGMHDEKRLTAEARAARVAELVRSKPGSWVVWTDTNYEADALKAALPEASELRGDEPVSAKTAKIEAFADGRERIIITKPKIASLGLNWQHAANQAFVGLSYSYEAFYQAIRRSWRFGQANEVNAHVVAAETEGEILRAIQTKQREHETMKQAMVRAIAETGLRADGPGQVLSPVKEDFAEGRGWTLHMGDNCQSIRHVADDSVGLIVSSLPFEDLYIYSDSEADMGNSANGEEFFAHMGYLIPQLLRVTKPGRLCVMHCKDLPLYKGRDGAAGLRDFPGEIVKAFESHGWTFHSRVTIWKDPVTEMQRTKNHGLLYKMLCKDSCNSRQGMADYLLVFRAWKGETFGDPVTTGGERFDHYVGMEPPDAMEVVEACRSHSPMTLSMDRPVIIPDPKTGRWPKRNPFDPGSEEYRVWSIACWQKYASPVWFDIDQTNVLQYREARDEYDERHICPLQLDVIERCIHLWSNPGDVVADPFSGIGSTGRVAVLQGRKYVGIELKPSYFRQSVRNLAAAEEEINRPSLFDGMDALAA